ncbi:MAG TPA: helix-turn-helix transcriptional regulator [Streptosporangiaceae bacterium]|nr:helix-turn-helix transcriptional regulator [Streptosporangiaceae bacterium]
MTGEAPPGGGPTVRRILLGSQLRRLREAREITRDQAGYAIRASESKISRMELGRVPFKERDVADLLTLYQVTDEAERAPLLALANAANVPGWWHRYGDVLADWFQPYLGLEEAASIVRTYEVQFVPGLLQTPGYAEAVIIAGNRGAPAAEIERRVAMRMARQEVLTRRAPLQLWAVIDEAALRRPIGGTEVMRAQIKALIKKVRLGNVIVQVMPFRFGGHAAESGAYTILRFPEPDLPDVVYLEHLTSAIYLDKRSDVDRYLDAMERLCTQAEPPDRTSAILAAIRDGL